MAREPVGHAFNRLHNRSAAQFTACLWRCYFADAGPIFSSNNSTIDKIWHS